MSTQRALFFTAPLAGATTLPRLFSNISLAQWHLAVLYIALLSLQTLGLLIWRLLIKPNFFSSLRDLPEPPGWRLLTGHFRHILSVGNGEAELKWLQEIPNEGMLRTRDLFNVERLVVTTPAALEKLATDSFGWHKPEFVTWLAARVLGLVSLIATRSYQDCAC